MKTEADKLRNSIQYGLGVMDSGSGEFKELSNKIDELFELSYLEGQSSPNIKRLEWMVADGTETMLANIPFNNYYIIDGVEGMIFLTINIQQHIGRYATIDEAKAAAQADFEKRVRECLDL